MWLFLKLDEFKILSYGKIMIYDLNSNITKIEIEL